MQTLGIIGTIWCTIWLFAGSSNPYECRKITEKERNYLLSANGSNLKKQTTVNREYSGIFCSTNIQISWRNVPFKSIFTSIPFLAQLQCHFLMCFSSALLETYLPTYFKEVLLLGVITVSRLIVNEKANENSRTVSTFHYRISSICQAKLCGELALITSNRTTFSLQLHRLNSHKLCVSDKQVIEQSNYLFRHKVALFLINGFLASYGMTISFICLALFIDCSNRTLALIICCFLFAFQGIGKLFERTTIVTDKSIRPLLKL